MTSLIDDADRGAGLNHSAPVARRTRSYGPVGAAVAITVGVAGIALACWSVYENTRPIPRPRSASDVVRSQDEGPRNTEDRVTLAPGTGPGNAPPGSSDGARRRALVGNAEVPTFIENPEFSPVTNSEEANALMIAAGAAAGEQSTKIEGLTPTPLQTSDQINGALTRFLGPLTQGEIKNGASYISSNGGKPPESGTIPGIVKQIALLLQFCELDTAHMKVRKAPALEGPLASMLAGLPAGAVPMMINRNNLGNGNEVSSLTMPLGGLFNGSSEGAAPNAPRVLVTMPARLKGASLEDKKFLLGITLGQNTRTNTWVPQSLEFHSNDAEAIKALQKSLRPSGASSGDGSPPPKAPSGRG
ncbi:MAG: hypothetical protein KF691_07200 [Phycisphaeraceae bacterium]|nr:hypothetical protein [Phycisphaeraceae bacterium]